MASRALTPTFRLGEGLRVVRVGFSPELAVLGTSRVREEEVEDHCTMAEADPGLVAEAPP